MNCQDLFLLVVAAVSLRSVIDRFHERLGDSQENKP
jgi:hypothetical protein